MPAALTSIITPCRFPCRLKYQEHPYYIILGYDPDGTPCGMGRCRGGACLQLRHYFLLESFSKRLSSRSSLYPNLEGTNSYEHDRNVHIIPSERYVTNDVPSDSGNTNSDNGIPTRGSMTPASAQILLRNKRAAPRLGMTQKKPNGSYIKKGVPPQLGHGFPHVHGNKGGRNCNKLKGHLMRHKKKYGLAALATAVSATAVGLKIAKINTKPECRRGRHKSCKNSEEDDTKEGDLKHSTKTKKTRIKESANNSETEAGKKRKHKDKTDKGDETETRKPGQNGKKAAEHGHKERR
uniref:Glycine rich superfamily member n=1 Tax=Rhipicephalus zambeziensis TaxID=60191 RepID=A0A224Y3S5_9ACAR